MKEEEKTALAEKGIAVLRSYLSREYRYMTMALYYLKPVRDDQEQTLSTDGSYLFYNADYIISCFTRKEAAFSELQYRYLHVVTHCLLGHPWKKPGNEPEYDACADIYAYRFQMKLTGKKKKFPAASMMVCREAKEIARGRSIFGVLQECNRNKITRQSIQQAGKIYYTDDHTWWYRKNPAVPPQMAGSGSGRNAPQMEHGDGKGSSKQWEWIRSRIEQEKKAEASRRGMGHGSGEKSCEVTAARENASSYRELLRRFCRIREVRNDDLMEFDYAWYAAGLELYGNKPLLEPNECIEKETADHLVIALDVSGSCYEYASRFLRETINVIRDACRGRRKMSIWILECDDEIKHVKKITSEEEMDDLETQSMQGWGGTSFVPVFDFIQEQCKRGVMEQVTALLYFTDGYGDYPDEEPDYETIFLLPENERSLGPDWITQMVLTDEAIEYLEEEHENDEDERL